jgi:poly-gamma-glutamate synthase PgsB/CapB
MKTKKFTLRLVVEASFGLAFFLIWLPRALHNQTVISLLWPVYHWLGVDYYFRLIDEPGILVGSIILGLSAVLVREYMTNSRAVSKIPIRIHVTGIRGKTTTTRLIGAALRHSGFRVITKTTGKAARLVDEKGVEHRIRDHHELPNLREQPRIISNVVANGDVDAIVLECMSIRPGNIVAESKFVRPTISVITNVRADHLDVMGPTLEDVAWTLSGIIPAHGLVVTAEKKYLPIIQKRASDKAAKVIGVEEDFVSDELLTRFPYMVFKENIGLALAVCQALGIPPSDAIDGMIDAKPDPGLTRILDSEIANQHVRLIAAFGVNDTDSTSIVFHELERRGFVKGTNLIGLFHARDDRITRTLEFAEIMAKMHFDEIMCVGKTTNLFVTRATIEGYPREKIFDLGEADGEELLNFLRSIVRKIGGPITLFGCGNMIGIEPFIQEFENLSEIPEYQIVGDNK